jgi:hypothetical protein
VLQLSVAYLVFSVVFANDIFSIDEAALRAAPLLSPSARAGFRPVKKRDDGASSYMYPRTETEGCQTEAGA